MGAHDAGIGGEGVQYVGMRSARVFSRGLAKIKVRLQLRFARDGYFCHCRCVLWQGEQVSRCSPRPGRARCMAFHRPGTWAHSICIIHGNVRGTFRCIFRRALWPQSRPRAAAELSIYTPVHSPAFGDGLSPKTFLCTSAKMHTATRRRRNVNRPYGGTQVPSHRAISQFNHLRVSARLARASAFQ